MKRLAAIVGIGFALRAAWIWAAARIPVGGYDPVRYLLHAIDLAAGNGYRHPEDGSATAYYPAGYPLLLSLVFRVVNGFAGSAHAPVSALYRAAKDGALADHAAFVAPLVSAGVWLNALLAAASIVFVFRIGRALHGRAAGLIAAAWVACFPNLIFHTGVLLTETAFVFFALAALTVLVENEDRPADVGSGPSSGAARWLAAGALLGCAALIRPLVLAFVPVVAIALYAGRRGIRRTAVATATVALACAAVLAPWTVRNWLAMDAPVLVSTNLGDNLCIGHHPGAPGHFVMPTRCPTRYAASRQIGTRAEVMRNVDRRDLAIRYAIDHPLEEWRLLGDKLYFLFWRDHNGLDAAESYGRDTFLSPGLRSVLARTADFYFFATLLFGTAGFVALLWPPRDPRRLLVAGAMAAFTVGPLLFFGHPRFHVPLSPLLAVAGSCLVCRIAEGLRAR